MHLTSVPLAPFDNLSTFSSIEAGDLHRKAQGFVFKKFHFRKQNVDKLKNDCQ